jgi:salicylate hydroxylase
MALPKISVAIAGGGIGGLSLAAGLQNCPHLDVQVYEGTKIYKDVGGGLAIHPNVIRAMELVGENVKRAFFDSVELSAKDEDVELTTDVVVGQGKNTHEMLASLGAAKVSGASCQSMVPNFDTGKEDRC